MKCDHELNVSGSMTDEIFITKCCPRKKTRKSPESAMATFRAMEDLINPIMVFFSKISVSQKYGSKKLNPNN
jgi:hypothetical protein